MRSRRIVDMFKITSMVINSVFRHYENIILKPIKVFPCEFFVVLFFLCTPVIYTSYDSCIWKLKEGINSILLRHNNGQFIFDVALSYIVITCGYLLYRINKFGYLFIILIELILSIISIIELFLFDNFGMDINYNILQFITETNEHESSEFISTYILTFSIFKYLLLLFICFLLQLRWHIIYRKVSNICRCQILSSFIKKSFRRGIVIYVTFCLFFAIYCLPLFSMSWRNNISTANTNYLRITRSLTFKIFNTILQFYDTKNDINKCADSLSNIEAEIKGDTIDNIVIIIGESYNRHHGSLYGYNKNTNDFLSKISNLYVFDNVISSINGTSKSFQNFLSTASVDSCTEWFDEPLFPAIFKKAGFNVIFNSNQFVQNKCDMWSPECGFFFHPRIKNRMFSYTNQSNFLYDGELIDNYKKIRAKIEKEYPNLIIHHLLGQHVNPSCRFPSNQTYFTKDNYNDRVELSDDDKEYVASYDNATRYNDSIVAQIIDMYKVKDALVIYFADHGDEANDFRLHKGRAGIKEGAECLHCQLDIPFIIYLSEKFAKDHPDIVKKIKKSIHRPFMTDDLPHLLFDIANINTKWYKPNRSLINEEYNTKRRRIIKGNIHEGSVDYDNVCENNIRITIGFEDK